MKLYLSSYMLGDHGDTLIAMAGGRDARMAIITNALDYIPIGDQIDYARTQFHPITYFAQNGFDPALVDLRHYFGRPADLEALLRRHRVIWALGGNAFLLRRAMRESGFDEMLGALLSDGIVYAGWSAGACVAGESLDAVALMDDPSATAPGYTTIDPLSDGLALVPFSVIPHSESDHPEAPLAARAVQWAIQAGIDYRAIRDGDVIVRQDAEIKILQRKC